MKRMSSSSVLLFVILGLMTLCQSQNYIQGCSSYGQNNTCSTCEYAYSNINGVCVKNNNQTADCCSSYNSDGTCAQCSLGLFYSDPYCSRNNIFGCIQKQGSQCLACANGFTLSNNLCVVNLPNCLTFTTSGQCTSCAQGYKLINSYCVQTPQIPNCQTVTLNGCALCATGYYLTAQGGCNSFAYGCLGYWQQQCLACSQNFVLVNGACTVIGCQTLAANGCSACLNGYQLESNGKCSLNNCLKVVNEVCVECKGDYRVGVNGCVPAVPAQCQACALGFTFVNNNCIKTIPGCLTYTAANLCSSCSANFQLTINGACQIIGCISLGNNGCNQCGSPFTLSNGVCLIPNCANFNVDGCTTCNQGYILTNKLCVPSVPNCLTYINNVCQSCAPKYYLLNGICNPVKRGCIYDNKGVCTCAPNFQMDNSNNCQIIGCNSYDNNDRCIQCNPPFSVCQQTFNCAIDNCKTYSWTGCVTCLPGYISVNNICQLKDAYCLNYNAQGVCTNCAAGFNLDAASGKCFKNIPNCASVGNDQVTCTACKNGFTLLNGQCQVTYPNCNTQDASGCTKCNNGFRLSNGQCVSVDPYCTNYVKQGYNQICTACNGGYILSGNSCISQQPGCKYNGAVCISCQSPFLYDTISFTCFIPGCLSVTASGCNSCASPFTLSNGACIIPNCAQYTKTSCASCASGFILSNNICVNVDVNCLTFNGPQCSVCKPGYNVVKGVCVVSDPNCKSYNHDGSCSQCVDSCYFDVTKKCLLKQPGCIYEAGVCKYCTAPFVLNPANNRCQIRNCQQTSSIGCNLCKSPFILSSNNGCTLPNCLNVQQNACVQCSPRYHLKKGVSCEADDSSCLSYNSDGDCQLCNKGYLLASNGQCSQFNSTCLQYSSTDKTKCLSCASNYFLNRFYQCQLKDGRCQEYTNGVCSQCSKNYFLYSQICFPYTAGCVQYSGKDCTACKTNYVLKNGECFSFNNQDIGVLGSKDVYNFSITPIDVRQSKYYINNLSPACSIGKLFFSSYLDETYQDASLSTLSGSTGKGWKAKVADKSQRIGVLITDQPVTFYAIQLESVEGGYIKEFLLEYSVDGINFIVVQNTFLVPQTVSVNMTTIYFTGIYAKAIRINIIDFVNWPSCRIDFFYYDLIRFRQISNLKSMKYLTDTINSNYVDRVNNQIYINQAYFFNPQSACVSQELCFTGLQLCQNRKINSLTLNFQTGAQVNEFYLTYSVDGRSYNCYNSCIKISTGNSTTSFTYTLSNLNAQGVRIYPTKYTGNTNFNPTFYYE